MRQRGWMVLASLLLPACGPEEGGADEGGAEPVRARVVSKAQAAIAPFRRELKGALTSALEEGPGEAIDACRVEAPELAEEASSEQVRIGRTSHRLRNPDNAPKPWMEPLLEAYAEADEVAEGRHEVVRLDERDDAAWGYVEAIHVRGMCVTCHGEAEALPKPVREGLAAHYPKDRATGFEAGDFRGLFWVELRAGAVD